MTKVEQLMGEIVDQLAADPGQKVDPRAWGTLLIYAPRLDEPSALPRVSALSRMVHVIIETSRNIALDTAIECAELFRDGSPQISQCVAALRDLKAMMNPSEGETRQ